MSLRNILSKALSNGKDISTDYWYLAAISAIASANHPKDVECLYNVIYEYINRLPDKSQTEKDQLMANIVLKLREGALKSHSIIGFPKVCMNSYRKFYINAWQTMNVLKQLADITPDYIKSLLPTKPLRDEDNWSDVLYYRRAGEDLFNQTYGPLSEKTYQGIYDSHPDLAYVALYFHYGTIYGELSIVSAKETSLILVTTTMIQNVLPQLRSHRIGAIHNGATEQEIKDVESLVVELANYYNLPIAD
ncbi:hypothetical protein CU098_004804 [Rhizopus stolonifer]|uniref:Carboxymuconolactone decarboxylase-like domain-containing protein n=1 Tax=Rhizopus stolonifer TaxID=4846 RepID=A0A367IUA0_RHIST|nr:hypothetical protein CU098_004804 [Rhizopus stolonifer]